MEPTAQQRLDDAPDALDEFIAEAAAQNPVFPALLDEARERQAFIEALDKPDGLVWPA